MRPRKGYGTVSYDLPELVPLFTKVHPSGSLTVIEADETLLFPVRRVYFLHSLADDAIRGSHAHKKLHQLLVPVSGSFIVRTERSSFKADFLMDSPTTGLLIRPFTWRTLLDFSPGAVCMVLASEHYEEDDYIRDYSDFLRSVQ